MKYALIGCGRISINHIYALKNNHLEFVAMCDVRPKRMDALLEKGEIPQDQVEKFTDYKKMLDAHPDLQLVSIATESGLHAEIAIECLNRGINVIIEKPFAMSLAEADAILAASEKSGAKVGMMHQNRYNVAIQKMRQAYEEGRFGRISHASIHVRWNRNRAYYEQAPWRGTWAQDGDA